MLTAHTVADVREAETETIARTGADALMQRAARGLARCMDDIPGGARVLMLIGPGNNGGDALYAATHLLSRGVGVDLCAVKPDTVHEAGWSAAVAAGARVVAEPDDQPWVVDAMFGIGARSPLGGRPAELAAAVDGAHVISVDVPSGVDIDGCTDAGAHGSVIAASRTVTFGTYKPGLLMAPAAEYAGADVPECIDIGLYDYLGRPHIEALQECDGPAIAQRLFTEAIVHKYTRGVAGVAAGSDEYAGAAHLTVAGAQAGPAGMVRFVGDSELSRRVVDRAPETVAGPGRAQAWVAGPGTGSRAERTLREVMEQGAPTVIDADALAVLPPDLGIPAVLTPHAGELARMLGADREDVEADPLRHGQSAAEHWNATVLVKGKRTSVHTPGMPVRVNLTGSPWLATAGAGDVLAGLIGSWLAAGFSGHDAASIAAFLHGAAAVRASPRGPVTAGQVAAAIPHVTADFLSGYLDEVRQW